ncbi:MAG: ribonuclease HII [bacterium P3]|nr:MAG: ribonuclease HII [bacterium P3]KWW39061.1 MAG: ribonuclease HII [bacterium F083]
MLKSNYTSHVVECGCDEAGRGCLAGPVYAAAVILPHDYCNSKLNDSKQLSRRQRETLREVVEHDAVAWAVASVSAEEIDRTNILRASFHAMNLAIRQLKVQPELLLIDGNRFYNETDLPYRCIVKGDAQYLAIAAASVLAKTYRDEEMERLDRAYPVYGWKQNKGYPTAAHYRAIESNGISPWHRKSYRLERQLSLFQEL